MEIRWVELDPQRYEDMVAVLLSRLYPGSERIDGKGVTAGGMSKSMSKTATSRPSN